MIHFICIFSSTLGGRIIAQSNQYKNQMFEQSTKLCDVKYKIVFLGCSAVGKSAIIERFTQDQFDTNKSQTVGIDFFVKNITYKGSTYKMQLWDTAGQEKFKSLVPNYIRDANCAVFVYDISKTDTFNSIDSWIELFKNFKSDQAVMILVGNKSDIGVGRQVSTKAGEDKASKYEMSFCETSAKIAQGVEQMFHSIIDNICVRKSGQKQKEKEKDGSKGEQLSDCRLNKAKLVKIQIQKKKQLPCCYI